MKQKTIPVIDVKKRGFNIIIEALSHLPEVSLVSYTFPLNPTFIFINHYSVGCATRFKNPTFHLLGNLEWFVVQRTLKGKLVGAELTPNAVTAYES